MSVLKQHVCIQVLMSKGNNFHLDSMTVCFSSFWYWWWVCLSVVPLPVRPATLWFPHWKHCVAGVHLHCFICLIAVSPNMSVTYLENASCSFIKATNRKSKPFMPLNVHLHWFVHQQSIENHTMGYIQTPNEIISTKTWILLMFWIDHRSQLCTSLRGSIASKCVRLNMTNVCMCKTCPFLYIKYKNKKIN